MKYILLSFALLLTGIFSSLAQKRDRYLDTLPPPGVIDAPPPPALPAKKLLDTTVVNVAEQQAKSGFDITQFIASNFSYPPAVLEDSNFVSVRIMVEFIVEKDASISNIKIKRLSNPSGTTLLPETEKLLKMEVMRVMRKMPSWQSPAYQNGQAVRSYFNLPIRLNQTY